MQGEKILSELKKKMLGNDKKIRLGGACNKVAIWCYDMIQ